MKKVELTLKDEDGNIMCNQTVESLMASTDKGFIMIGINDRIDCLSNLASMLETVLLRNVLDNKLKNYDFEEVGQKYREDKDELKKVENEVISQLNILISAIRGNIKENFYNEKTDDKEKSYKVLVKNQNDDILKECDVKSVLACFYRDGSLCYVDENKESTKRAEELHQMICNTVTTGLIHLIAAVTETSSIDTQRLLDIGDNTIHDTLRFLLEDIYKSVKDFHYSQKMKGQLENSENEYVIDEEELMKQMIAHSIKDLFNNNEEDSEDSE